MVNLGEYSVMGNWVSKGTATVQNSRSINI